jgi:signal recognition particle subunit SRP54
MLAGRGTVAPSERLHANAIVGIFESLDCSDHGGTRMFENLTSALDSVFRNLRGRGKLSAGNVKEALGQVRKALLAADVNFRVAKSFVRNVEQKAVGQEVLRSISPGQLVVKIVHDELVALMGGPASELKLDGAAPAVVMFVGLQGSGKTTACAKLARLQRSRGLHPHLIAADIYRPAAIDQLVQLGESIETPVFSAPEGTDPVDIVKKGIAAASKAGDDLVIIDTAGRLNIDDEMMTELERLKSAVSPQEILFVADAMTGQVAADVAKDFAERLDFTGIVLSKMDGDARGGAALSIREVSGKPIKFVSTGETLEALDVFHPDRMASRILGMGDVVSFVERAQQVVDQEQAEDLEKKLRERSFTLDDFLSQLEQVKKMGPLDQLMGMLPGVDSKMLDKQLDDKSIKRVEAIVHSMTRHERGNPEIINGSRRRRIASGCGRPIQEVNRLLKQFDMMRKMLTRNKPTSATASQPRKARHIGRRRARKF